MFANPTSGDVIQAMRDSLLKDIMPELQTDRARVTLMMIDTMLVSLQRRIPVEQQWMADECNRMSAILAAVAGELAHEAGPIASEIRSLVSQMPAAPDFPAIPAFETINSSYREISMVFTEIVGHLNDLAGQGSTAADALLTEARAYINLRVQRDMAGFFAMDAGMVGRG